MSTASIADERLPVTIVTGFLGSGKTTLVNHILHAAHGRRIAVIENEFGEAPIDGEILLQNGEEIVAMANGCICCTVRGDLVRLLGELHAKRASGALDFERVVIETTGLADPAPVAQTFFVEEAVAEAYRLDGIVTLVDAKHGSRALDEHREAQKQVGFADRLLMSKTDLVSAEVEQALTQRLARMNARAPVVPVRHGRAQVAHVLDIGGFALDAAHGVDAQGADHSPHDHDDEIASFVYRTERPFDLPKLENLLGLLIERYGEAMLRYKGILNVAGREDRIVFQGVHGLLGAEPGARWADGERRESALVFIGRNLPRAIFENGLALCAEGESQDPASVLRACP